MTTMSDDVIKIASAYNRESGIILFYLESVVNVSADVVFREDWDHVPDYPKWNPNFLHTEVVLDITSKCRLTYQVTTPMGNGLIWSRDAVTIAYWNKEGDATYLAFSSTSWPALPPSNRYVRLLFGKASFFWSKILESVSNMRIINEVLSAFITTYNEARRDKGLFDNMPGDVLPPRIRYSPLPGDPEKTLVRWVYHVDVHLAFVPAHVLNLVLPKACRDSFTYYRKHALVEWKGE
ncbi:unnamed protein product [Darwinula stevensoni]|uniref:START domain-containing protein n=1 Tax=Darwinula stevensoni TaxID=69355 RepID=A0A7R8X9E6_9CRUS|nr:unnamed protein product [Darwinula stevensoni]CAG0889068.1 unnamed protein product [Darwinula stevensoni]